MPTCLKYSHDAEVGWVHKRATVTFYGSPHKQLMENISTRFQLPEDEFYIGITMSGKPHKEETDFIKITDDMDVRELRDGDTVFIYNNPSVVNDRGSGSMGSNSVQPAAKRARTETLTLEQQVLEVIKTFGDAGGHICTIVAAVRRRHGVDEAAGREIVKTLESDGEIWKTTNDDTFATA